MRYMKFALVAVAAAVSLSLCGCPPLSPGVSRVQDLTYGKGYVASGESYVLKDLYFDLVEMDSTEENRPAVLMIHGGSFESGDKMKEEMVRQADALALAGHVCFLINYRLKGDNPPAPEDWEPDSYSPLFAALDLREPMHAAFVDAKTAMRYIRANAAAYRVDPSRIAIWGESAGAFAALAAGLTGDNLFSNDGPGFDVPEENNPGVDTTPAAIIDLWGSAAPVINAFDSSDPPIMILHGSLDFTVGISLEPAVAIRDQCDTNNIPYAYYPIAGAEHGVWDANVEGKDLATLTTDFLATHLAP
jgi:dipeptidyl aminopeptidase/acylaminoacyl peptidase